MLLHVLNATVAVEMPIKRICCPPKVCIKKKGSLHVRRQWPFNNRVLCAHQPTFLHQGSLEKGKDTTVPAGMPLLLRVEGGVYMCGSARQNPTTKLAKSHQWDLGGFRKEPSFLFLLYL